MKKHYIQKGSCRPHMDSYPQLKLEKQSANSVKIGLKVHILDGWSIAWRKILSIVNVVILFKDDFFYGVRENFTSQINFRS